MREDFEKYAAEIRGGLMADAQQAHTAEPTPPPMDFGNSVPEWEHPIPFDDVRLPDFPVDMLPKPVADFVEALAESTQTPPEMGGLLSLGALAMAFQRRYSVEVNSDWQEPLSLYTVAVAPPADRKSSVIGAITKPAIEWQAEQWELEEAEIAQNKTERKLLEKALEAAQNSATKGKGNYAEKRAEALDLSRQLAEFEDLHKTRLLVDDCTQERLTAIMEEQAGCITVTSSEGGLFDMMAGRYDRQANLDVYLKAHSGDPISVDRVGRSGNYIPHPHMSMILTVQPSVLHGLMDNPTFRGRGLCGRFLFSMCHSKVGSRKISPAPMPLKVKMEYHDFIKRILSNQGSGVVKLSPDADKIRIGYQSYIEPKLAGELEYMSDWAGKLTGAVVRIAALIHLSSFTVTEPINPEVMVAATSIGEFLMAHAKAAYMVMGSDEGQADAKYLWRRIRGAGKPSISKNDMIQLTRGRFRASEDMEPALNMLADMGYIKRYFQKQEGRGRPKEIIMVNPYAVNTVNTEK